MTIRPRTSFRQNVETAVGEAAVKVKNNKGDIAFAGIGCAFLYAAATLGFNAIGGIMNDNDVRPIYNNSYAAYAKVLNVKSDSRTIPQPLYDWKNDSYQILHKVSDGGAGFTFTFRQRGESHGLLKVGSRYNLALLPAATPTTWPSMTLTHKDGNTGDYSAVMYLPKNWGAKANAEVFRIFMTELKNQEQVREELAGTYKIGRDGKGALKLETPYAAQPAQPKPAF
jgi:hypothetical protein